jgi:type VI secretion system protein ImpL
MTSLTNNLPELLLFVALFGFLTFVIIAYFAGTSFKGVDGKFHQMIFYRLAKGFWLKVLRPLYNTFRKYLFFATGPLYDSIKAVKGALKEHIAGKDSLYRVPWYAVVGDALSQKEALLESLPLSQPIASPKFGLPQDHPYLSWWFFEKGIVVDVAEKCLYEKPKNSEKTDWVTFLKALTHYRPRRPLDGLILALPAAYFYGKAKLSQKELKKRAEALSQQLIQVEKVLGFKVPLYCVLTGLDVVPGFKGFCHEIPQKAQQEMFGWSSGYSTDTTYQGEWIKEAFQKMQGFLFESILSVFARGKGGSYGDDMVIFLNEFPKLEEGVTDYLNTVLRVNDYRDHFIMRGLYGTGLGKSGDISLEGMRATTAQVIKDNVAKTSWFFLKDLFQEKIFKESGVAFPIKRFLYSANRAVMYLKIAILAFSIIGTTSLIFGYVHLRKATAELQPALMTVLHDVHMQGNKPLTDEVLAGGGFEGRTQGILTLIVKAANYPLQTPFLASSLVSSLDDDLYDDIASIYNLLIARPMYMTFSNRAESIMKGDLPLSKLPSKVDPEQIYNPTKTPEFMALSGYVDAVALLEDRATLYNELRKTGSVASLEKVIQYLYGFNFPQAFLEDSSPLKEKLMKEARYHPFNLENYRLYAERRLYELYNAFLERILDPDYIYRLAAQLQGTLEKIDAGGIPAVEHFYNALLQIKDLMAFASPQGADWLIKPQFDLGDQHKAMTEKVQNLFIFSDEVLHKITKVSHALHEKAVHYLKSYGSTLSGYFFATSPGTHKLEPSHGLRTLEKGLGLFLHKPFMSKTDGKKFARSVPRHQLLHWDRRIIQNAIALIENYEDFLREELPGYPAGIQDTLRVVALEQLQRNIENMLERAQTFFEVPAHAWGKQAEDAARLQVDNVQYVGPLLVKLLTKLDNVGGKQTYSDLKNLIFSQMYENLRQLDQRLMDGAYYLPLVKDFSWWKGDKRAIFKAYGMQDKAEMQAYFENQTQHAMHLILEYGAPVMQVLKSDMFSMNIQEVVTFARWDRLLEEAVAYQNKKAVGSLKALETFLLEEGNDLTEKDCLEKITLEDVSSESGDYFLQKRNAVRNMLFKQCQKMNSNRAVHHYNKIATYFNSFMANTFPFINGVPDTSKIAADVSDKILQEFFGEFDKLTPEMYQTIKDSGLYTKSWKDVKAFLTKMSQVRDFMHKYFAPKIKDGDPGIDFRVEFRQNQMREKHADKVLDWAVIAGDQSTSTQEGNKPIRWEFGKTIAFGFQWAMDAPLQPVDNESISALTKAGGRSMYIYQGYWALLRAMMVHRTPPQQGGSTRNDTMLGFEIPIGPNPQMNAIDNAKLFIRIIPQTAKGLSDLGFKIPDFPVFAPKLALDTRGG